jgi:hypothetical protein
MGADPTINRDTLEKAVPGTEIVAHDPEKPR